MQKMPVPAGGYKLPSGRVSDSGDKAAVNKGKKKGAIPPQFLKIKGGKK